MWTWIFFLTFVAVFVYVVYAYIWPRFDGDRNAIWIILIALGALIIVLVVLGYTSKTSAWLTWLENAKGAFIGAFSAILGWLGFEFFRSGRFVNTRPLQMLDPRRWGVFALEDTQRAESERFVNALAPIAASLNTHPTALNVVRTLAQNLDTQIERWQDLTAGWETEAHNHSLTAKEQLAQDAHALTVQHRTDIATQLAALVTGAAPAVINGAVAELERIITEAQGSANGIVTDASRSTRPHSQQLGGWISTILAIITLIWGSTKLNQTVPEMPKTPFEQLADASKHCPNMLVVDFQATQTLIEVRKFKDDSAEKFKKKAEKALGNPKIVIDKIVAVRMVSEDNKTISQCLVYFDGRIFTDDPNIVKDAKFVQDFPGAHVTLHEGMDEAKTNDWIRKAIKICNPLAPINVGGVKGAVLEPPDLPGM